MKVIYNKIIPFKGFTAINLFGVVFVRKDVSFTLMSREKMKQHEAIHTEQMKETLYIGFYLLYFLEWLYRLVFHRNTAYKGISFEREAYYGESMLYYIQNRKRFAMWRNRKKFQNPQPRKRR